MLDVLRNTDWAEIVREEENKPYFSQLLLTLQKEYTEHICRPSPGLIFNSLVNCSFNNTKVVILGQDPYPSHHAHGLSFSSLADTVPFSLKVIFKDIIQSVYKIPYPIASQFPNADLTSWTKQGVLLLNTVLTVRDKKSGSHKNIGWEQFTGAILRKLAESSQPVVFMLWGKDAHNNFQAAIHKSILGPNKLILTAGHPAAAAYGRDLFTGCNHFNLANEFLLEHNELIIKWKTIQP